MMTTLRRRATAVDASSWALLVGSAIYVAMWTVVGRIEEVRIFLRYAVALVPLTCASAMQRFLFAKAV